MAPTISSSRRRPARRLPEGYVDQAPDVYSVTRLKPDVFQVRHFPDADATQACCNVKVEVTEADRRRGAADGDASGAIRALARANVNIDKKHGIKA